MAVGDGFFYAGDSYLGVNRETGGAYGTYVTASAGFDFISASLKTMKDSKILEQVERKRTYSKAFQLGKTVAGDIENYFTPDVTAMSYFLQNALGGTVTSATATGEITGGGAFLHTFETGNLDQTYRSLSMNQRKGGIINGVTSTGRTWRYTGGKINTLSLVGELDEPLKMNMALIFKDSTQVADDIDALMTATAWEPLSFANGRFSVESSFASLTSSSFWHVQNINFTLNNNLKNDASARRIGSDVLAVLPIGVQSYDLSCQIRFDTTTAYDAMINGTEFAAEFEFLGTTYSGSAIRRGLKLQFQKVTVKDAGDPEISGPDEVLTSNVVFNVLRDESASGYAVRALLTNNIASV